MSANTDASANQVNEHYLDHVLQMAQTQSVEASEDIVTGNGLLLLAKGSRIDARVKDRLLEHKLRKPLEECMRVSDGVSAAQVAEAAQKLLDTHATLRALYSGGQLKQLGLLLKGYATHLTMQSLLTVYAQQGPTRLEHAVGVGLLTLGMAKSLTPYADDQPRVLLMAGLFHDIGELYIAPGLLARGATLTPEQWRHIAAHPIITQRVLKDMIGMGQAVGKIVVGHHERLDGYGYPNGLRADALVFDGQLLAVAEMLSGLLDAGPTPLTHADVALKLIPGEFTQRVIDLIATARRACQADELAAAQVPDLNRSLSQVRNIATVVRRLNQAQSSMAAELERASATFKGLLLQAMQRTQAIGRAFSSTGMDTHDPEELLQRLAQSGDAQVSLEITLVLKELGWRLKELERELTLRVQILAPKDAALLGRLFETMKESAEV